MQLSKRVWFLRVLAVALSLGMLASCGFRRKKYENPITKDTQQPDKVLFDKAVKDLERNRFEVARLTLQTLINTYDTSEYLAKAKLAIADSWFREGGAHGLAQAEAEYKDFILFYPTLEESAEAQEKVCMIHYRQMEKPDRDSTHALKAEEECRNLLVQFPNSKYAPQAQQLLRNIQEAIADGEFRVGDFYHHKGSHPAAANRLQALVDQYPLYSGSDEALWTLGDSYSKMGPRFRDKTGQAYTRIVKDYPLSPYADQAKQKLKEMEMEIPEPDPVALARMKYEEENRTTRSFTKKSLGLFSKSPDVTHAAKSGTPAMERTQPTIPASVPVPAAGTGVTDVSVSTVNDSSTLDSKPDARANPPKPGDSNSPNGRPASTSSSTPAAPAAQAADDTPKNKAYQPVKQKEKKEKKKKNKKPENK
ncbi:MAG: outer membrane protein assembly factor BamD [Bryobacterales bacterium]|nr:outer membrane protein assembly factor BamD [Bryobacterales bacterium]